MSLTTELSVVSNDNEQPRKRKRWLQVRHIIVALLFLATTVAYASRVVLSVAIVGMLGNDTNTDFPSFDWDKQGVEGYILSCFFWGYSAAQIPSGIIVQRYGTKWPIFIAVSVSSVCVLLTPIAAIHGGWVAMVCVRVLQGVTQAALYPSLHASMATWSPLDERGRVATIIFSGSQIGTILTFPIAGYLIPSAGGWPSVFYLFGGLGLAWSVVWFFLGSSSPSVHPFISKEERDLIELSISNKYETKLKTPWKEIFTSRPMWALILSHCTENFGFWTLLSEIPTYMKNVLKFDIEDNGVLSALPYLVMAIMSFVFGSMADFAFKRNWTTVVFSRKFFNTIGFWVPAVTLIGLGFTTKEQHVLAIVLLVVAVGFNAGYYAGFALGHMDLSPNFAGVMLSIGNCAGNIFSTVGTLVANALIKGDKSSTAKWQLVFGVTSAFYFFGNLVYIIFGDATRQPWNEPDYKRKDAKKKELT